MYRDHSTKGSLMQEVWVHGPEQEAIRRRYIETRYRLLPYIYTLADESSRTGLPMMRPIFLEFPEIFTPPSNGFNNLDTEFLLGPSLLVAPQPFAEMLDDYVVSFPKGQWYDFWTGLKALRPCRNLTSLISPMPAREQSFRRLRKSIPRSTLCRSTSGAEVFCRCSRSFRALMRLPTVRSSFVFTPASRAPARFILMTATPWAINAASFYGRRSRVSPMAIRCGSTSAHARERIHHGGKISK